MKKVSRYHHSLLVTLHRALAVLIIAELTLGFFGLAPTPARRPGRARKSALVPRYGWLERAYRQAHGLAT
jgi:hypothetical protein